MSFLFCLHPPPRGHIYTHLSSFCWHFLPLFAELQAYTDKYKSRTNTTTTSLDWQALGLDKAFFPEQIWTNYFEPKKRVKGGLADGDDEEEQGKKENCENFWDCTIYCVCWLTRAPII